MANDMILQIIYPECVELSPGVFEYRTWWNACSAGKKIDGEYTVEPMAAELLAQTNTRIEDDAKAKMTAQHGITVDGRVHLYGGRSS